MGQIEDLKLFVTIVDAGGIAKAADILRIAKSAVSRRLGTLEERYAMRLIDRQPGVWEVTTSGQELYQRAIGIVSDIEDLDSDFIQTTVSVGGPLRVSIAREFGLAFLKPMLFEFANKFPQIDLTLNFDDRFVDLDSENYDLAVRITNNDLSDFEVSKMGSTTHGLYASQEYLDRFAPVEDFGSLRSHTLLHFGSERRARWEIIANKKKRVIEFKPFLNSNNGPFLVDAAIRGLGIIRLPKFIVSEAVASRSLVQVLANEESEKFGIYTMYSRRRRINRRMRHFIDAMKEHCAILDE